MPKPHARDQYTTFDEEAVTSLAYPEPNGRLDRTASLTLLPAQGEGLFSSPGLEGHRNGQDWAPVFRTRTHEVNPDKGSVTTACVDEVAQLALDITLRLDPDSGVLGLRYRLTNSGEAPYQVQRFALIWPIPPVR